MFESEGLNELYKKHKDSLLPKIVEIEDELQNRFFNMDDAIESLLLAAMSGETLVLIGPPGTAKSRLIRSFCNIIGLVDDSVFMQDYSDTEMTEDYFEYLLTQFTEPSELFGFYDLGALSQEGRLVKLEENMMQRAKVVFLDEVFNASSAILNSLLTFMNERKLHDRGEIKDVNMKLLVAATNHPPKDPTLKAVYDRFLLRCRLTNVAKTGLEKSNLVNFLDAGWNETHGLTLTKHENLHGILEELEEYQQDVDNMSRERELVIDKKSPLFGKMTQMVSDIVKLNLSEMTNRRLVKLTGVMLAHRLLEGAREEAEVIEMIPDDLRIITRYSIDRDDPSAVAKITQHLED